jgi:aryl-alcohol dehydrogenase-like predicted oxidoreductase
MITRELGINGPKLTIIGYGAWAIGGSWEFGWGAVDDKESIKAVHHGLELGINWIDTAAVYGLGHSEEIIAQALRGIRDEIFLATKCGMVWNNKGEVTKCLKPGSIRKEVEDSLRRLKTDHIDLYQIHWPDAATPIKDSWSTMAELKSEGKVRNIGVCNYSMAELDECRAVAPVQSLQPIYNMLERNVERELLPYCQTNGIGVVAYSPMASGLLTGKFDFDKIASDDWRRKNSKFNEVSHAKVSDLLDQLKPVAERYTLDPGELAVAWVLANRTVTSAIVGARKAWQIEEIVGAADINMSTEDYRSINRLLVNI